MIRIATLLLALVLVLCSSAQADVLVPGTIRAHHTLRFVDVAKHPGWSFYVHAPDTPIVVDVPANGVVGLTSFNSIQTLEGIHLYAVPASTPVPADQAGKLAVLRGGAGVLRSNRLVDPIHVVRESTEDPEIVTEYSITIGDALVVEQVGGDATPRVLPRTYLIPAGSIVAIAVVLGIRRRRLKRAANAAR